MKLVRLALCVLLAHVAVSLAASSEPGWWLRPQRLLQTNLREIDAQMDLEAYLAAIRDSGTNVVLFNTGGIVANYPTDLPYHFRNPYLKGDLTGEVVRRLHAAGIRVISRFDFSKVNATIAVAHPEWQSRDRQGQPYPPDNGQVNAFLKARNPALCICTYTSAGVDVIRKESNTALPTWAYDIVLFE